MVHQRAVREWLPRNALDQLGGRVALAMAVNLVMQPLAQWLELARRKLLSQAAQFVIGLLEELCGVQVTQRIRREVTDSPALQ